MTPARRFALRLARSAPVRRLASPGSARRAAMAGRALRLQPSAQPRAGYISSRGLSSVVDSEAFEKYYKMVRGASAVLGLLTATGGGIGAAAYYVIGIVDKGVDQKLQVERDSTAAKMEAERVRTEDFRTLATKTHLDTVRKLDETVSDLRSQFNSLSVRCLEGQYLEAYYRSQIQKAQEVIDREGATTSSEVHVQLLWKINNIESQIALLTEELKVLKKNSGAVPAVPAEDAKATRQTMEPSQLKLISGAVPSDGTDSNALSNEPSQKLISGAVPSDGTDSNALSNEPSQKKSTANDGRGFGSP